jgi:hypothetical protein
VIRIKNPLFSIPACTAVNAACLLSPIKLVLINGIITDPKSLTVEILLSKAATDSVDVLPIVTSLCPDSDYIISIQGIQICDKFVPVTARFV